MSYLLGEIWTCLVLAFLLGGVAGWLVWGRRLSDVATRYAVKLERATRGWESVEARLEDELARSNELASRLDGITRERDALAASLHAAEIEREETDARAQLDASGSGVDLASKEPRRNRKSG